MDNLDALFTLESLLSLQGSAAAALLVPNVLGFLIGGAKFNNCRKWISFFIAMGLSYLAAALAPSPNWVKWVLASFNGFLVFASAVGINQAAAGATVLGDERRVWGNWF